MVLALDVSALHIIVCWQIFLYREAIARRYIEALERRLLKKLYSLLSEN